MHLIIQYLLHISNISHSFIITSIRGRRIFYSWKNGVAFVKGQTPPLGKLLPSRRGTGKARWSLSWKCLEITLSLTCVLRREGPGWSGKWLRHWMHDMWYTWHYTEEKVGYGKLQFHETREGSYGYGYKWCKLKDENRKIHKGLGGFWNPRIGLTSQFWNKRLKSIIRRFHREGHLSIYIDFWDFLFPF